MARGGETTETFRTKALFLCVRALRGRRGATDFVRAVGAGRIFEDETKPVSRELWLRALREFEKLVGDGGFRRLSRYLVHPKNLGVWSTKLRGAQSPYDIYRQLDEGGGDYETGWIWRQRGITKKTWSGEICFLESDTADDRRRIRKALSAELRCIPLLFGLSPARVTVQLEKPGSDKEEVVQNVVWRDSHTTALQVGLSATLGSSMIAGLLSSALGAQQFSRYAIAGTVAFFCAAITYVLARDIQYRATSRAQHIRILALEREGSLQKLQVKEISHAHEEPVLAGKYRLGPQLGIGASGAVWQAKRLTDGATVAIKLLRTALAQDPRATDRLRREAQALGLSWHPHVVEVLDDGLLPSGVGFLVTELLKGETLGQRIQRKGALSAAEAARFGVQASDALVAIHSAGVIHRDVKPSNLFIHQSGSDGEIIKLIDFGVAAVSWAETRLTRNGARVGTPGYAAPEQDSGDEVDARADLFSLGQSLKHALTGVAPPSSESQEPAAPQGVPIDWAIVLHRLTAKDREDRYATARDARRALSELLEGDDKTDPRFFRTTMPPI